jgi:hypothetical protein
MCPARAVCTKVPIGRAKPKYPPPVEQFIERELNI